MTSYRLATLLAILPALLLTRCESGQEGAAAVEPGGAPAPHSGNVRVPDTQKEFEMSDEEWREKLTPEQYRIMRQKGTERAFTGKYWDTKTPGAYKCAGCGQELFTSKTKFDSGCGWPSFYASVDDESVATAPDDTLGTVRTEILCSRCGSHLGHVFEDGPQPTGLRYCVNSASIELEEE